MQGNIDTDVMRAEDDGMISGEAQSDWIDGIAEPARVALAGLVGGVLVRLSPGGAECVSRVYPLADYADSGRLHDVVAAQLTRHLNGDSEARNHYAVHRYRTGAIVAYSGRHYMVREWPS